MNFMLMQLLVYDIMMAFVVPSQALQKVEATATVQVYYPRKLHCERSHIRRFQHRST